MEDVTEKKEPWEDQALKDLNIKLKQCKDSQTAKKIQKEIRDCRKRLRNEYFQHLADDINSVAEARQVDKEFSLAKKYTAIKTGVRTTISREKLKTHFESHFAVRPVELPPELKSPEEYPHLADPQFNVNQDEPTREETKKPCHTETM